MNKLARKADETLKSTVVPEFANPKHEAVLLDQLLAKQSEMVAESGRTPSRIRPRLRWAMAAGLAAVVGVVVLHTSLKPAGVWAEVLSALDAMDSFVMTETSYRETEDGTEQAELATCYFREDVGMAMVSPRRRGWNVDGNLYVYDVERNQVTVMRGLGMLPIRANFRNNRLLVGFGEERDHGDVVRDGRTLHLVEMVDPDDPTERVEIYADPESMLPEEICSYTRNTAEEPWRLARHTSFQYNVAIDDAMFVPDYPEDAELIEKEPEMAVAALDEPPSQSGDWMEHAAAITWYGDKFLAVEDVWVARSGWIGLKLRTNLYTPFVIPMGFREDAANQERWHADRSMLHNLAGGTLLTATSAEDTARFISFNGASRTEHDDGTKSFAYFYHPEQGELAMGDFKPSQITFQTIANVRDKGRGESLDHYWDWKDEPEKWQLLELTVPAPAPSDTPPASFNEKDLAWMERTEVERNARSRWLNRMRTLGRGQEAYDRIHDEPADVQRLYGADWLHGLSELGKADEAWRLFRDVSEEEKLRAGYAWILVLVDLGKADEAKAFFERYKEYCEDTYGEDAHLNIDLAQTYLDRLE